MPFVHLISAKKPHSDQEQCRKYLFSEQPQNPVKGFFGAFEVVK